MRPAPSPHGGVTGDQRRGEREGSADDARAQEAITLDTYADLFPDDLEAVVDALDAAVRRLREPIADALRTEPESGS